MIEPVLRLAKAISDDIPSSYQQDLEDRLAIAWGEQKRNRFRNKPRTRAENIWAYRKNRARQFYLKAQDTNCFLFLPFVLAYSPRACVDLRITEVAQLEKYGRDQVYVDAGLETKKVIERMAIGRGFSRSPSYLNFMKIIFPEGSQESEVVGDSVNSIGRQNSAASLTNRGNSIPPNEKQSGPTASSVASISYTNSLPPNQTQSVPTISSATSTSCVNPLPNETQTTVPEPSYQPSKLEHASQQGIADVFNKRTCDAIRGDTIQHNGTTYLKAAVTMSFPIWVMDDCIITLAIHESKVEDLAKALFNVQVESWRNVRSLVYPGGVRVVSPTVKGVPYGVILDVFGLEVYEAVVASNTHEKELADGFEVPQCVSMIIPASCSDTVVINLTLETVRAMEISNKIFP